MKTFDIDIFQLLILLGSVQGLIFTAIIFIRKKLRIRSNIFLSFMIVFIALSNIQHILIDMNYLAEDNFIRKLYLPLQWLIMPMFYLHIHEVMCNKKLSFRLRSILFIPVVIVFLMHIIHFGLNYDTIPISEMPDYYSPSLLLYTNFISFLYNGLIFYLIYRLLVQVRKTIKKTATKKLKELKWYSTVIAAFILIATLGLIVNLLVNVLNVDHRIVTYTFLLLVSLVGYYLGYVAVYRSTIKASGELSSKANQTKGLSTYEKISSHIIEEKSYLDQEISLTEIAANFDISTGYLSQLFNTHSDQNFNDYINRLRIETSKKMLLEKQFENYTIESIGIECGFKSKSNFYTAFKKYTGKTPRNYAKR